MSYIPSCALGKQAIAIFAVAVAASTLCFFTYQYLKKRAAIHRFIQAEPIPNPLLRLKRLAADLSNPDPVSNRTESRIGFLKAIDEICKTTLNRKIDHLTERYIAFAEKVVDGTATYKNSPLNQFSFVSAYLKKPAQELTDELAKLIHKVEQTSSIENLKQPLLAFKRVYENSTEAFVYHCRHAETLQALYTVYQTLSKQDAELGSDPTLFLSLPRLWVVEVLKNPLTRSNCPQILLENQQLSEIAGSSDANRILAYLNKLRTELKTFSASHPALANEQLYQRLLPDQIREKQAPQKESPPDPTALQLFRTIDQIASAVSRGKEATTNFNFFIQIVIKDSAG